MQPTFSGELQLLFYETLLTDDEDFDLREKENGERENNRRYIRASVDALCRDDPSEISRDTRTKCLQTRRESLARPSKHTNNNF